MALLVILICLGLQRYLDIRVSLADFDWFKPYYGFLEKNLSKTPIWVGFGGVAAVVLPAALAVALVDLLFNDWFKGILGFLFSIAVLFYCLDARDYGKLLSNYLKKDDESKGAEDAEKFVGSKLSGNDTTAQVSEAVFTKSLHQIFSVLFWFCILGPFGAVLYFMVALVNQSEATQSFQKQSAQVLGVMDWIPVRLVGLTFALVGSFSNVFMPWVKALSESIEKSNELAVRFGLASLGIDGKKPDLETVQGSIDLCFRAEVVWVVVIALLTVASYFG